jgi:hypothetical protein
MMLTKKSDLKLEKQWERKRSERVHHACGYIVAVPPDMADMRYLGLERPEGLRSTDFVQELERLALEWGDRRFAHAVRALRELDIVNERGRFTRKRGPHATSLKESAKAYAVTKVQALMTKDPDLSEWEACAAVAEDLAWEAASFEAAIGQLRQASRRARKGPPQG